jgi:transcriptional regulator with XRE-family HTH domain
VNKRSSKLQNAETWGSTGVSGRRGGFDFERIATELVRAVRADRSQAALSRAFGYRSNIVSRWEAGTAFPAAARFLSLLAEHNPERPSYVAAFFGRMPPVFAGVEPTSRAGVAAFLRELRGKTPILSIARDAGVNRYSVSRWLSGDAEPRLPELLLLVEVMSGRLLDFLSCLADPRRMNSVTRAWDRLELTRSLAYEMPWSHAVLRALELDDAGHQHQKAWLSERLGITVPEVTRALGALVRTGQVKKHGARYELERVVSVDTSRDRQRRHGLKIAWTKTALARMEANAPGDYGYSVFSISRADLRRLRELHLEYVRAMQYVIGASEPGECVGLFCAQLLDLASKQNALGG